MDGALGRILPHRTRQNAAHARAVKLVLRRTRQNTARAGAENCFLYYYAFNKIKYSHINHETNDVPQFKWAQSATHIT
jgi:hypothetical protein